MNVSNLPDAADRHSNQARPKRHAGRININNMRIY